MHTNCKTYLCILILLASCSESLVPNLFEADYIFGNASTLDILKIEFVLNDANLEGKEWVYDIDHDGNADLRISSVIADKPFVQYNPNFKFETLSPNLKFSGSSTVDTVFYSTIMSIDTGYIDQIFNRTYNKYSCEKSSSEDQVFEIKEDILNLRIYTKGDIVDTDSEYAQGSSMLTNFSFNKVTSTMSNDTTYYEYTNHYQGCGVFPKREIVILVFKFNDKLGWMKLGVFGNFEVFIAEIALEK